ncbi:MAG: GAF domain-containing protein [Actinomycetota bacterium]|nr:MAG: GAF domain-containing protein [Actinomycetota bacterium]
MSTADSGATPERPPPTPGAAALPALGLDELLDRLVSAAHAVGTAQERLRGLLHANQLVAADLELPTLLRHVVEAACELVHARFGAIGVLRPDRTGLEQFIYVGVDEDTASMIGRLPEGKGLLGALIDDPTPIRLQTMHEDPRSVGFPPHHPPMRGFLGVPIRLGDEVFGNLYLTERIDGDFTAEDQELVLALAASAARAIENARLYDEARQRQAWLAAATEITRQLLAEEAGDPLATIASRLQELGDADAVAVALPTPDPTQFRIEASVGAMTNDLTADGNPALTDLMQAAHRTGNALRANADIGDPTAGSGPGQGVLLGPTLVIPFAGRYGPRGILLVARRGGRRPFTAAEQAMATTFANQAAIALELADSRADQQRMTLLEDRDRIARDLHDHVIQRLFAVGLTVQRAAAAVEDTASAQRLSRVVDDLDDTIRQIRTTIFDLRGPLVAEPLGLRDRVREIADAASRTLGYPVGLSFSGPVDTVDDGACDDVLAVVREGLSNVMRHARASRVDVHVELAGQDLTVEVLDDGVGLPGEVYRSGLHNLDRRARRRGGALLTPHHDGTHLRWTIPWQ